MNPDTKPKLDLAKGFIGDLARPFAIISTSYAAAHATIVVAHKVDSFEGAATFMGAVFLGVAGLYGAKAYEVASIARGKRAAPPQPAAPDTGELPESERIP